jgi:transposase
MSMATLLELLASLDELDHAGDVKATSVRMPEALHHAVAMATELGMAESFTAATNDALASRVRAFARQQALAAHLGRFPHDQPELEAVVRRRVSGTDHPAALHEQLTVTVAQRYEQRHPDWAVSGEADHAVDQVLELVEMLVEMPAPVASA